MLDTPYLISSTIFFKSDLKRSRKMRKGGEKTAEKCHFTQITIFRQCREIEVTKLDGEETKGL